MILLLFISQMVFSVSTYESLNSMTTRKWCWNLRKRADGAHSPKRDCLFSQPTICQRKPWRSCTKLSNINNSLERPRMKICLVWSSSVAISFFIDKRKNKLFIFALCDIVQFWTPSPVTQRRGERVQDHLSAHARRLVSFLANGYCTCVHLAWQYGGRFEGIGWKVHENLFGIRSGICRRG